MNINCLHCGKLFGEWDTVICDGCQRPTHRESCGTYDLVVRDGESYAYFFCNNCSDDEWEAQ